MTTTKEYLRKLRQFKKKFAAEYGIKRIGIFGSVARGEQTEDSDIDIFFESESKMSLFKMGGILYDLKELLCTNIDLVHNTEKLNPNFRQRIEKDLIYV